MTDLVEQLRDGAGADGWVHPAVAREAADEIERLRNHVSDALAVLNACRITIKNRDQRPDEMKLLDAIKIVIAEIEP